MRVVALAISETPPKAVEPADVPEPSGPAMEPPEAFTRYRNELLAAGVLVTEGRLAPTRRRVRFDRAKRTVLDGPFVETREIVGGY